MFKGVSRNWMYRLRAKENDGKGELEGGVYLRTAAACQALFPS